MTTEEYLKKQKANKDNYDRLTELGASEQEKKKLLDKMLQEEYNFLKTQDIKNLSHPATVQDNDLEFSIKPTTQLQSGSSQKQPLMIRQKKVTPENFFDNVSCKNSEGKSVDIDLLKEIFNKDPKKLQILCDLLNLQSKSELQSKFGNSGLQMVEDNESIGFKRDVNQISDMNSEATNIVKRAEQYNTAGLSPKAEEDSPTQSREVKPGY